MSAHTLAYIEKSSVIHRSDALSKLLWVLIVVAATFQFKESASRGWMLAALLLVAIFVARVPVRSILVASADDPYGTAAHAAEVARVWGSELVEVGAKGHVNAASRLGAWPEGRALLERLVREGDASPRTRSR